MADVKFMEYRYERIKSNIEFLGGYSNLPESEKAEYQRLRAYFVAMNNIEKKED